MPGRAAGFFRLLGSSEIRTLTDGPLDAPDQFADLDAHLSRWLETMPDQPKAPTADLSPDLEERLRALGYLGEQ